MNPDQPPTSEPASTPKETFEQCLVELVSCFERTDNSTYTWSQRQVLKRAKDLLEKTERARTVEKIEQRLAIVRRMAGGNRDHEFYAALSEISQLVKAIK